MKVLEILFSFINRNFNVFLLWIYNKKVDEVKKLEAQVLVIKEETEIAHKQSTYIEQKEDSDGKVLTFKQKMKEYNGDKH